ncbi:MAG: FemAB family PEP-CTERM system-associated protein [Polyangiales bacterium]
MDVHTRLDISVRPAVDSDQARWNGFVDRHPDAQVYHRWEWGGAFRAAYGTSWRPLIAMDGLRVRAVLPLCRIVSPLGGVSLVSLPWFGHAGVLADGDDAFRATISAARASMRAAGARRVELRHAHAVPDLGLPSRDDKVLMRLELPSTEEELFKRVGPKLRADIRRPEKEGMSATLGGLELLPEFHRAYASVMRDLGSPCHDEALFAECFTRMPERSFFCVVRYEGRPVGGGFLAGMGDTLEIPCAGTLHAMNRLRPNMLLYWTVIREAIRLGYKRFSFGRSSVDTGTYAFKKNWGAEPHPLAYHYLLAEGAAVPDVRPDNPKYQRVIQTWQRLPLALTNRLGPHLVRHLS